MVLSLALGIGGLTAGAVECSARDETLMDLFTEQAIWPSIIVAFREAYSTVLHHSPPPSPPSSADHNS